MKEKDQIIDHINQIQHLIEQLDKKPQSDDDYRHLNTAGIKLDGLRIAIEKFRKET